MHGSSPAPAETHFLLLLGSVLLVLVLVWVRSRFRGGFLVPVSGILVLMPVSTRVSARLLPCCGVEPGPPIGCFYGYLDQCLRLIGGRLWDRATLEQKACGGKHMVQQTSGLGGKRPSGGGGGELLSDGFTGHSDTAEAEFGPKEARNLQKNPKNTRKLTQKCTRWDINLN